MRTLITSLFLLALALPAAAQSDRIETDRPGVVPSPYTVPMGTFQAELGALNGAYTENAGFKVTTFNFPLQLRYGLTPGLELRVQSDVYEFVSAEDANGVKNNTDGFTNLTAGIKYTIPAGAKVNVVVIPEVIVPIGEPETRNMDDVGFSTDFVARFDLGESPLDLSVVGGLDVLKIPDYKGDKKYFAYGNFAGRAASDFSESARLFAEIAFRPQINDFENRYALVGIGAKFLAAPNVAFDIIGHRAFATDGPYDWDFGLGVSTRF